MLIYIVTNMSENNLPDSSFNNCKEGLGKWLIIGCPLLSDSLIPVTVSSENVNGIFEFIINRSDVEPSELSNSITEPLSFLIDIPETALLNFRATLYRHIDFLLAKGILYFIVLTSNLS